MSRLREAAQAVVDMFYHRSWGTTSYIPASVEALRDALAEPDEVLAEREACARVVENYAGAWDDEGFALAQEIRARGNA